MDTAFLLKGGLIGLSIAAPVGPIGVLCIRRTLAEGRLAGLVSGLGAATADAVYGCIAGLGLSFVSAFLVRNQGVIAGDRRPLPVLPGHPYVSCHTGSAGRGRAQQRAFGQLCFDVLADTHQSNDNPVFHSHLCWPGIGQYRRRLPSASLLVLGVFVGSALWWLLLSSGIGLFRARFPTAGLVWVNRMAGVVIAGFGVGSLAGLL
jgi:hypothetical protein